MNAQKIAKVQKYLRENQIDGWLLYDFHKRNHLALQFLGIPESAHLTRRFFYWIPAQGEPVKIVHTIESHVLDQWPGKAEVYLQWQTLEGHIAKILNGVKTVAMEYSPRNAIPYVSQVDAGVVDLVREQGAKVVSSSGFLQHFTCVWTDFQVESHKQAADVLDKAAATAWAFISKALKNNQKITEYDVQQLILNEYTKQGFISEGDPNCSVNAHSSDPHYSPPKTGSSLIQKGDFVLIDLWCKKNEPNATYADITRVAVADTKPSEKQQKIFNIVFQAQKQATDFVKDAFKKGKMITGYQVDQVTRKVIQEAGYGEYFTHRTGHNIHTEAHGPGTNLDSLETYDERPILPGTCFSIEPGIYLPNEFGIRLEYDVYVSKEGEVHVSGGIQEKIVTLV